MAVHNNDCERTASFVHTITMCSSRLVLKFDLCVPKLTTKSYSLFTGKAEMGEEELIQTAGVL